jgi:lincosamide and streptogramin A transport system ATP-binding/permease protein
MRFQPDFHKTLVSFEDFSLAYGDGALFQGFSEKLNRGEILALTGANAAGKSSIARMLFGKVAERTFGGFSMVQNVRVSCVRQIYENHGPLKEFAQAEELDFELFLSNLKKLGMEREVFRQPIEAMSQGQQKKVELAKSLSQEAQLYVWDEPLNYLDVFNREQIADLLRSVKPTMLLIEHDADFVQEVSDKIVEIRKNLVK